MKGIQFYAVMPEERRSKSASKAYPHDPFTARGLKLKAAADPDFRHACLAVDTSADGGRSWRYDPSALCTVIGGNLKALCWSGVSLDFLRARCVRIPESLARRIHPQLLRRLEG